MRIQHKIGEDVGDRYTLTRVLGVGAFAEVWLAIDRNRPDRSAKAAQVALKILHAHHHAGRGRERFIREANLLAVLDHPGIARAIDYRCDDKLAYIALEYIEGETLLTRLMRFCGLRDPSATPDLMSIFRQTCEVVHYAHQAEVVHRDLKPTNIMIVGDPGASIVKVLDFGIAKLLTTESEDATTRGRVLGTETYLSPEQLIGGGVDHRADIFALGTILFEMLTLRRPWLVDARSEPLIIGEKREGSSNDFATITARIVRMPRPSVRKYRPDLPPALDEIVRRALAPAPADRIKSAQELTELVDEALGLSDATSTDSSAPPDVTEPRLELTARKPAALPLPAPPPPAPPPAPPPPAPPPPAASAFGDLSRALEPEDPAPRRTALYFALAAIASALAFAYWASAVLPRK